MAQIVKLRRSSVPGQKPTNSNLQLGELALNTTDGKVYMAKSGSLGPSVEELISTNTVNTGSIFITGNVTASNFSGSFKGDGSQLYNIPSSGVTGLELNKIVDGSATASISQTDGLRINTKTEITGSVIIDGLLTVNRIAPLNGSNVSVESSNLMVPNGGIFTSFNIQASGSVSASTFSGSAVGLINVPFQISGSDLGGNTYNKQFTKLQFDDSTGLNVSESVPGTAFISIGSHFKDIFVSGSPLLSATGSDAFEVIGAGGLGISTSITDTNGNGYIKELTISAVSLSSSLNNRMDTITGSITTLSSSLDSRINTLNTFTSSVVLTSQTSSMNVLSASYALTAAFALNASAGNNSVIDGAYAVLNQTTPATTWTFKHSLGQRYPIFQVFDSNGVVIIPSQITTIDIDNATITFSSNQTGKVIASLGTGPGGLSQYFSSNATWSLAHNLGSDYPIVTIWDSNRNIIFPQRIESVDTNNIKVYFSTPVAGYVNVAKGGHIISGSVGAGSIDFIGTNIVSGSAQILITGTTGYSTFSGSISSSIGSLSSSVATTTLGLSSSIVSLSSSVATTTSGLSSSIGSLSSSVATTTLELSSSILSLSSSVATTTNTLSSSLSSSIGSLSSSVATTTSGLTSTITSLSSSLTSSIGSLSSSIATTTSGLSSSIGSLSSSVATTTNDLSSSIGSLSSSVATTTSGLTSTITTLSSSLSGSIDSLSSSVASINNTQNGRLDSLETASGSIRTNFNTFTSSYNTGSFTGSFKGDGGQLYNIPSSGITGLSLFQIASGSVSASISPDNGFRVNTDVYIDGTLTAKEIHTDYVTSSVLYQSGSTKFGDTSDDNHLFTGSVLVNGNVSATSITGSINFNNLTNVPTLVSGSSQINITGTTDYSTFSSSVSTSIGSLSSSVATTTSDLSSSIGSLSSSIAATTSGLSSSIGSLSSSVSTSIGSLSSSVATTTVNLKNRIDSIEGITGSISSLNSFTSSINTTIKSKLDSEGVISGSIQVIYSGLTGIPSGIVSGSSQILNGSGIWSGSAQLPTGVVSGSSQIIYSGLTGIPSGIVSGSEQLTGSYDTRYILSGSITQTTWDNIASKPSGIVSGSEQIIYSGLTGIPSGIVSSSSQIIYSGLTGIPSDIVSGSSQLTGSYDTRYVLSGSITQTTWDNIGSKPSGIISGSVQIVNLGFATTSSNDLYGDRFLYINSSATGSWVINHNLGFQFPNVDIYDSSNQILIPQAITATSTNSMQIDFATPTAGKAILTIGGARSTGLFVQSGSFYNATTNIGITGSLVVTGDVDAANFNTTSDKKLKTNLVRIENALDKIEKLNGYTFDWLEEYSEDRTRQIGMVADEVYEVQPELISHRNIVLSNKEEKIKLLDYSKVNAILIEAIKELNDKVTKLENKKKKK